MRPVFATLFDRDYLAQGWTLLESIFGWTHPEDSPKVYVLACDTTTLEAMKRFGNKNVCTMPLATLEEEPEIMKAKKNRSRREYMWTLASQWTWFVLEAFQEPSVSYIDADMYFFGNSMTALNQARNASIAIVPHKFSPDRTSYEVNGRYCVSLVSFRNDREGKKCLARWSQQCLDWCYYKVETERFGDQKYLNGWPATYENVHIWDDPAVHLAPWNLLDHDISEGPKVDDRPVTLFNFQGITTKKNGAVDFGRYRLRPNDLDHLYTPYAKALNDTLERIKTC